MDSRARLGSGRKSELHLPRHIFRDTISQRNFSKPSEVDGRTFLSFHGFIHRQFCCQTITQTGSGVWSPDTQHHTKHDTRERVCAPQSYTKNVDIWAFSVLVHRVLTSEIPFLERAPIADSMTDSSASRVHSPAPTSLTTSMELRFSYCPAQSFPITTLQHHLVSPDGIGLVRSLMTTNPTDRVSAAVVFQARWSAVILNSSYAIAGHPYQSPAVREGVSRGLRPTKIGETPSPVGAQRGEFSIPPQTFPVSQSTDRYLTGPWASIPGQSPRMLLMVGDARQRSRSRASSAPESVLRTHGSDLTIRPNQLPVSQLPTQYRTVRHQQDSLAQSTTPDHVI